MKCLAIRRDDRFSPNAVENDRAILRRSCELLSSKLQLTEDIQMVDEQVFVSNPVEADVYLSMARLAATLSILTNKAKTEVSCSMSPRGCSIAVAPHLML